jgi:hypothetical protein
MAEMLKDQVMRLGETLWRWVCSVYRWKVLLGAQFPIMHGFLKSMM